MAKQIENKPNAFKRLYDTNVSSLVRFARRYTLSDMAEDIVQDVFMELWESNTDVDEASSRSFLFTAVKNRCINLLKHEQVKMLYIHNIQIENQLLELDYFDSIEKQMIETEDLQRIYKQIDLLPDKCRQIFKLAYFEDKKNAEIAELLHLSVRTVEHQIYLGLKALRRKLINK
ncbi:MAG: RNA polymerase sigma-70 factor [Tannerella sp.]|jgi:RNA polymerase sigma-70 factor (ECF subfamily)|nr:RNA polymerase sigma-70 factor [Tannerella sp.]